MNKNISSEFEKITQLGNEQVNDALILALKKKNEKSGESEMNLKLQAELHRKSGQLKEAQSIFERIEQKSSKYAPSSSEIVFLKSTKQDNGFERSPLLIIDSFLEESVIDDLMTHTLKNVHLFRKANVDVMNPKYKADIRNTLVLFDVDKFENIFKSYLNDNITSICNSLGIPNFRIKRIEIKITNHTNGGFFKAHADNTSMFGNSERVVSWLYYFHKKPKMFTGGELYVFDSHIEDKKYKEFFFTKIKPLNNRFVAFPSCFFHAVGPTQVQSAQFADGRMAVAGHIRFQAS